MAKKSHTTARELKALGTKLSLKQREQVLSYVASEEKSARRRAKKRAERSYR